MLCQEIMKRDVVSAGESDSVMDAARRMRDANVGILPVCSEDLRVVGVLTDRDLALRVCAEGGVPDVMLAGEVMTREVVACRPEDDLGTAEELMILHRKSRILVTDKDGRLRGLISLSDIARHEEARRTGETLRAVASREAIRPREEEVKAAFGAA